MSEDRVRRIIREEIAMTLVKIVRRTDATMAIVDPDPRTASMEMIREAINAVAEDMVNDLARTSQAGGS